MVVDGDRAVVFCGAKWRSKEGKGQGPSGTKTQLQLRRDFLGTIGPRVYGDRGFVVCGVVLATIANMFFGLANLLKVT